MDPFTKRFIIVTAITVVFLIMKYYFQNVRKYKSSYKTIPKIIDNQIKKSNVDIAKFETIDHNIDTGIINNILEIIEDKTWIIVDKTITDEIFEITFSPDMDIFIKIHCNLRKQELEYSSWYEKMKKFRVETSLKLLNSFRRELEITIANNGINPFLEIKKEIGAGAFKRWNEFTHRMIIESKKTKEQVLEELKKYGLKEEIAIKFIALYYD
jgi:hypothetical protein